MFEKSCRFKGPHKGGVHRRIKSTEFIKYLIFNRQQAIDRDVSYQARKTVTSRIVIDIQKKEKVIVGSGVWMVDSRKAGKLGCWKALRLRT